MSSNFSEQCLDQQVHHVVLAGDSMCALMSVKREGACFRPYFQNWVGEIKNNLAEVAGLVDVLEESLKIAGNLNPTDICTRGLAISEDVKEDSTWMRGPGFLSLPRESWPLCVPDDPSAVPRTELRAKMESAQAIGEDQQDMLGQMIERLTSGASRLTILVGALARILVAMGSEHGVRRLPEPEDRRVAFKLLLHHQQASARRVWQQGKLDSLAVDVSRGPRSEHRALLVTRGRLPTEIWKSLVGMQVLPVLLSSAPLARLIVREVHQKDHRKDVGTILADTRRYVWIIKGR